MSSDGESVSLALADVPPGSATTVEAFGTTVAVFNVGGTVYAMDNNCPHHQGPLCRGRVGGTLLPSSPYEYRYGLDGRVVTCPWHKWQFDLTSGRAIFDPNVRVPTYATRVEDGAVVITLPSRDVGVGQ